MKILILSSPNPTKIAGVVAHDLYNGLNEIPGNEVKLVVKAWSGYSDKNIVCIDSAITHYLRIFRKKAGILSKRILGKPGKDFMSNPEYIVQDYNQTIDYYSTRKILRKIQFKPEVVIVMFMQNFISYKNLYELNQLTKARIILYPMDMSSFTGACHYSWSCNRYTDQCGRCPAILSDKDEDQSTTNWKYKTDYIQKTDVSVLAANSQLEEQIKQSSIFKGKQVFSDIFIIPDEKIFQEKSKRSAREILGIDQQKMVLFFGSHVLSSKRKGMQVLINALNLVFEKLDSEKRDNILLLVAGKKINELDKEIKFAKKELGFINDYEKLAIAYSASDYYISPSLEDSGPTMVLQSMFCLTPVICFDIGYARDLIISNVNGFKSEVKSSEKLAELIYTAINLNSKQYGEMRAKIKENLKEITREKIIYKINECIKISLNKN